MESVVYVGLSRQMALRHEMDITANNLANMNTTAFKREQIAFREYVMEAKGMSSTEFADTSFVQDYGVSRVMLEGALIDTGNQFDVSISGQGFLMVEGKDGEPRYTRNGRLALDDSGRLITQTGEAILDSTGNDIVLSTSDTNISIAKDGTITSESGLRSQLALVTFADEQALKKVGDGLFSTTQEAVPATNARFNQGTLESSNVIPVMEITRMVQIVNSYQTAGKLLEQNQDLERKTVERLGRLS